MNCSRYSLQFLDRNSIQLPWRWSRSSILERRPNRPGHPQSSPESMMYLPIMLKVWTVADILFSFSIETLFNCLGDDRVHQSWREALIGPIIPAKYDVFTLNESDVKYSSKHVHQLNRTTNYRWFVTTPKSPLVRLGLGLKTPSRIPRWFLRLAWEFLHVVSPRIKRRTHARSVEELIYYFKESTADRAGAAQSISHTPIINGKVSSLISNGPSVRRPSGETRNLAII